MSGIFIGNQTKLFYNNDAGNNIPNAPTFVQVEQLAEFPQVKINSSTSQYSTYNQEYTGILAGDKSIDSVNIVVHYVPDDVSHQYLDAAFASSKNFQIKVSLYESATSLDQHYAIINGYISSVNLSGDQNSVVNKTYVFTAEDVIARGTARDMENLKVGDYGVGANGSADIPQYESSTPAGNAFIKVPAGQALNPTGVDMLGIAGVDGNNITKLAFTESGVLGVYVKNQASGWQQLLTKSQNDAVYVPLTRTVNGKALSTNIVLNSADTGSLALTGGTLTGALNGTTAKFSGAVQADSATITGALTVNSLTLQNATIQNKATVKDLEVTGGITANSVTINEPLDTSSGGTGNADGTVARLTTSRSVITNLASKDSAKFDGSLDITPGVSGILSVDNGGTGNSIGESKLAIKLSTPRTLITNLASNLATAFDGSSNNSHGVTGTLPITNGGTGAGDVGTARTNLQLNRFQQFATDTRIVDPNGTRQLFLASASSGGDWGVFDTASNTKIALPGTSGGTGAITLSGGWSNLLQGRGVTTARNDLGLGSLALLSTVSKNQLDADLRRATFFSDGRINSQGAGVWSFDQTNFGWNEQYATTIQVSNQNTATNAAGNGIWQHYLALGTTGNILYVYNINGVYGSTRLWSARNTAVDGSGFIKQASPVVRLVSNVDSMTDNFTEGFTISGSGSVNDEAEGVVLERTSLGKYKVYGSSGLHSDGWQIEVPKDVNGNRLCFIETEVEEDNTININVFKPKLDLETGGIRAGDPIDIPDGRWIDLRLDMPEDSIFNVKTRFHD